MKIIKNLLGITILLCSTTQISLLAEPRSTQEVTVGIATPLSGDLAAMGHNIVRTVEAYQECCLRHPVKFVFEDAKRSSMGGLRAYQKLLHIDRVDLLIGGTTSNGTLAAKEIIDRSKTPLLTPLTGGSNIDSAGPYIFRIGSSDILNGIQQAEQFHNKGIQRVAVFTEETEYTQDIVAAFRDEFISLGGKVTFDQSFLPSQTDFRSEIVRIRTSSPEALFMPTQSGLAFGLFVRQLKQVGESNEFEIHTNFLAAENPEALEAGGPAMSGVYYLKPDYHQDHPRTRKIFEIYQRLHGGDPTIPFHTAGTVDALDLLQNYLDQNTTFSGEDFRNHLLSEVMNYDGLMGRFSFDERGNTSAGFAPARIIP